MIEVLKSDERGHANHGWLDSHFSFSFSDYYDPKRMGFRSLRVINEDWIAPGTGFGTHPHRDMEIITYLLEGAIEHKDSMGSGGVIKPGEIQRMSAGTGIFHSEQNGSQTEKTHLLQIWIMPEKRGINPSYEQIAIPRVGRHNKLAVIASRERVQGAVQINQDASLYSSILGEGKNVTHSFGQGRYGWLQVARGGVKVNGKQLDQGDGAAIAEESALDIIGTAPESEFLLFDLA